MACPLWIMDKWLGFIRAIVRPFVAMSGWVALIWIVARMVDKFGDRDTMLLMVGAFGGGVTTFLAFYFQARSNSSSNNGGTGDSTTSTGDSTMGTGIPS